MAQNSTEVIENRNSIGNNESINGDGSKSTLNGMIGKEKFECEKSGLPIQSLNCPNGIYEESQKIIESIFTLTTEKTSKVIGFVSSKPLEGTTTIASIISLMILKRQNGYFDPYFKMQTHENFNKIENNNIILIDTQIKHPSLHNFFTLSIKPGLYEFLNNGINYDKIIRETYFANLKLITSGDMNNYRFSTADFDKLNVLLNNLRKQFELVFIDIPPLLQYSEGIALSRLCDSIILVVRANKTKHEIINEAKNLLNNAKVNILGLILNRRRFFIPNIIYNRL